MVGLLLVDVTRLSQYLAVATLQWCYQSRAVSSAPSHDPSIGLSLVLQESEEEAKEMAVAWCQEFAPGLLPPQPQQAAAPPVPKKRIAFQLG